MALRKALLLAATLSTALGTIHTDDVMLCGTAGTYIDGGVYMIKYSDGTVSPTVGNQMNGTMKFDLGLALTNPADNVCCGPEWPILLLEEVHASGEAKYRRYNLTPYIDVSPGAFAPLRFTSDNSTLAPGETTWGWMTFAGMLLWSPTGHEADVPPAPPADGGPKQISVSQGWQLVPTDAPGVVRVYWNQTQSELNEYTWGKSWAMGQCFGDYEKPYNFVDDL